MSSFYFFTGDKIRKMYSKSSGTSAGTDTKYAYEYFTQNNVCRLCWSSTNSIEYVQNHSVTTNKILEYIGIDVTTGTPNKVCNICLNKIKSFIDFKKSCQTAEEKLNKILSQKFEENYANDTILKKEVDLELKILADEMKKEKLDSLIIKQENDSNFEIDDSVCDYEDLLPKDNNYCYICTLNFDSKKEFKSHIKECHKPKEMITCKCNGCKDKFKSFSGRTAHELHSCKAMNEIFNCNICHKKFTTYHLFESHMRMHETLEKMQKVVSQTYQCPKCPKKFQNGPAFRRHLCTHSRIKNDKRKRQKIICDVCGQIYSKTTIYMHMLIHTNYKQLKCPHCDYRATLRSSLKTHIKQHTGERPFACDRCPYRCITSSNLNKHRKTHMGDKDKDKYTCHICQKGYRYNYSLRDHITTAHQGERKHHCKKCSASYFHFKGLRKHILVKHGQRVRKVKDDFVELDEDSYTRTKRRIPSGMSCEDTGMSQIVK